MTTPTTRSIRRQILVRTAKRVAVSAGGALTVWLGGAEAAEVIGNPTFAALLGFVLANVLYDLSRAAREPDLPLPPPPA